MKGRKIECFLFDKTLSNKPRIDIMDLTQLTTKERYLFCKQRKDGSQHYFRATFLGIVVWKKWTTMICHKQDDQSGVVNYHMDAGASLLQAQTLTELLESHPCKLPDDVLGVINSFW